MASDKQRNSNLRPWQPGQSGNPAGRPVGSRNLLSEAFLSTLSEDFEEHGKGVIEKVRENDPSTYMKIIAQVIPKEHKVSVEFRDQLTAFLEGMHDITPPPIVLDAEPVKH